jgi:hypothetical protein
MTEEEWFASADAEQMLPIIEKGASPRKLRLFMVGVCRCGWEKYAISTVYHVLNAADGYVDDEDRFRGAMSVLRARHANSWFWGLPTEQILCDPGQELEAVRAFVAALQNSMWTGKADIAAILRDVVGNPFQSPEFDPSWRTDTAILLAKQMYESRDFGAMPILADALQEAGCENEDILGHCRDASATHVRGCWVVDLVLGKN